MAKETVKAELEEVKLETADKMAKKTKKKEDKKEKKPKKKKEGKKGFFKQVIAEIKMVTWPTRKQVIKYSIATILMVIILALFFIAVSTLFDLIYSYVQGWIG